MNLLKLVHLYKQPVTMLFENMVEKKSSDNTRIQLECSRCKSRWIYRGKNPYFCTCTFCKRSVNIKKGMIQAGNVIGVAQQPESEM